MTVTLAWLALILAVAPAPTNEGHAHNAPELFRCDFGDGSDRNYDSWPDGWTRAVGPKYPNYVKVRLVNDPADAANRCLQIELDGGAAIAYSPALPINPHESLELTGKLTTAGLHLHRARFSVTLLNASQQPLATFDSPALHDDGPWTTLSVGPFAPPPEARYAVVGLHLEPTGAGDLSGTAYFDDLRFERLVRIDVQADQPQHLYLKGQPVHVQYRVCGFGNDSPRLFVELLDADHHQLAEQELALAPPSGDPAEAGQQASILSADWTAPIERPGFYRIRSKLTQTDRPVHDRQLTVVVYEPRESSGKSEFGWSFPQGEGEFPLNELPKLVAIAGNGWLKFPVWMPAGDERRVQALTDLVDRCGAQNLHIVGLLNHPPEEVAKALASAGPLTAAGLFTSDPKNWYPAIENVLSRLGLRIRWWQLGDDDDTSFIGYSDLQSRILTIKHELDRIGQDVYIGFAWNWIEAPPPTDQMPWRFVTYSGDPPLAPDELGDYLEALQQRSDRRWVSIAPLAEGQYDSATRVGDLLRQMIAAKAHGASAIFAANALDSKHGLLEQGGTPGELFLPWRTAAMELGGAAYLGQVELPGGSRNELFSRDGEAVMAVWNAQPTEERLYLGEKVRQFDAWERELKVEQSEHEQVIQVGPVPTFVSGVNEAVARWRSTFSFANARMPSVFGQPHRNACHMQNHFALSVSGRVQLVAPPGWSIQPSRFDFKLGPGETLNQPLEIMLPFDATSASQDVQAEIEVMADRRYRFHVLRRVEVGLGDLVLEAQTRLNEFGELEVEQRIINNTDRELSFRCSLFAPGRRRTSVDLERISQGQDTRTFVLPGGKELLGQQLWIRAEELDGDRVLNHRFEASP